MTATDLNDVVRSLASLEWFPEASRPTGVLVVSSDLDTRLLLAHHLENLGYCVWTGGCGSDAYQIGIEHPVAIDMLLCDEGFSDMPAPQLYARLKTRLPGLRCCVIATTKLHTRANEAARLGAVVLDLGGHVLPNGEPADLVPAVNVW